MTPYEFLLLVLALTAGAVAMDRIASNRRRRALAELARQWRMHYSPRDVFHLAERVAHRFPVAGAARVHVCDLIYGIEGHFHRYIFAAEFTIGIIRSKKRQRRVLSFREPKGRTDPTAQPELEMADSSLPPIEQYNALHSRHTADQIV